MASKLPIGIQSFASLRLDDYVYVDKTALVYRLAHEGKPYFLSRPRRFGKSLLISTLKAYWEGRRELFEGLAIEDLEAGNPDAWQPHPVFHFDFNGASYITEGSLEAHLSRHLKSWEVTFGIQQPESALGDRFRELLARAHEQTGMRCVVLVDEYDKPLLEAMENSALGEHNRAVFKGFFSVLKAADDHVRFAFITGVTKFSKVSIFSDLNQLRDISMSEVYAGICGICEDELEPYFCGDIDALAESLGLKRDECLAQLRAQYDGYRFHPEGPGVYNPFSLLNALSDRYLGSYWFATGTPTFLVRRIRKVGLDPKKLTDGTLWASEAQLTDYRIDDPNPVPLLYQTGYLTIKGFDMRRRRYTLGVPNGEVEYGLLENLASEYAPAIATSCGTDIFTLDDYIESGDLDGTRDVLAALFASIPYTREGDPFENYFQAVIFIVFTLLGRFITCEMHSATGRVDCVLQTEDYVYVFEFKRDGTADEALAQIEEKGYALSFVADTRTLYRVGCSFDSATRLLADWKVV